MLRHLRNLRHATSVRLAHAAENPLASCRDVNEKAVAYFRVRQAIRFIHPTSNGARVAANLSGERLKVEVIF
jgi:hypothetical protein